MKKRFRDYINEIFDFYKANGIEIEPLPKISIDRTRNSKLNPFISTANYNPSTRTITLFIDNRQLKDILRSFCHELIHHNQFLTDERYENMDRNGKLNENEELEEIESDAYERGNILFRKWTETYK